MQLDHLPGKDLKGRLKTNLNSRKLFFITGLWWSNWIDTYFPASIQVYHVITEQEKDKAVSSDVVLVEYVELIICGHSFSTNHAINFLIIHEYFHISLQMHYKTLSKVIFLISLWLYEKYVSPNSCWYILHEGTVFLMLSYIINIILST